jgi:hypothetical protein
MQSETQKPQNHKNNENSPKHVNSQTTAQLFRDREALNLFASRWEPGSTGQMGRTEVRFHVSSSQER